MDKSIPQSHQLVVCVQKHRRLEPIASIIPEQPTAAHSRGSAATESPRASAISCAREMWAATEMRCAQQTLYIRKYSEASPSKGANECFEALVEYEVDTSS